MFGNCTTISLKNPLPDISPLETFKVSFGFIPNSSYSNTWLKLRWIITAINSIIFHAIYSEEEDDESGSNVLDINVANPLYALFIIL